MLNKIGMILSISVVVLIAGAAIFIKWDHYLAPYFKTYSAQVTAEAPILISLNIFEHTQAYYPDLVREGLCWVTNLPLFEEKGEISNYPSSGKVEFIFRRDLPAWGETFKSKPLQKEPLTNLFPIFIKIGSEEDLERLNKAKP